MFCRNDSQLNDCRIMFVDEVFKIEPPNERSPLIEGLLQCECWSGPEHTRVGGSRPRWHGGPLQPLLPSGKQGRAARPASTARMTRTNRVASVPATCAAGGRLLRSRFCVTSVTWPSTCTVCSHSSPASPPSPNGEWRASGVTSRAQKGTLDRPRSGFWPCFTALLC